MRVAAYDLRVPSMTLAPNLARLPVSGPATELDDAQLPHASGGK